MDKTTYIRRLFDGIAPTYDRLNHLMSLGCDRLWRRRVAREVRRGPHGVILDVACGTGDLTLAVYRAVHAPTRGIDLSAGMLAVGRRKVAAAGLAGAIALDEGDCERLPYGDATFDVVCCGFGVRNFRDFDRCVGEMWRVTRPGGRVVILELSVPDRRWLLALYKIYFLHVMPAVGGWISGDRAAYAYLPRSVMAFMKPAELMTRLRAAGYVTVAHRALTFGLARLFVGTKPAAAAAAPAENADSPTRRVAE